MLVHPLAAQIPVDIWVDVSNNTGIEDGSAANPYNTIQEGLNNAGPGITVWVRNGTYRENVAWPNMDGIILQRYLVSGLAAGGVKG